MVGESKDCMLGKSVCVLLKWNQVLLCSKGNCCPKFYFWFFDQNKPVSHKITKVTRSILWNQIVFREPYGLWYFSTSILNRTSEKHYNIDKQCIIIKVTDALASVHAWSLFSRIPQQDSFTSDHCVQTKAVYFFCCCCYNAGVLFCFVCLYCLLCFVLLWVFGVAMF